MIAKYMMTALAGSAMLATAALAQTPSPSNSPAANAPASSAPAADSTSHAGEWRASKVVGLKIYNDSNESLGSVNDLLFDKSGKIVAAVIGVGGFLGVGEHYVAVPYEKIKWVNEPVPSTMANAGGSSGASGSSGMTGRPASTTTTGSAATTPASKPNPWYPDHGVLSATKDELKAMPEFKYST